MKGKDVQWIANPHGVKSAKSQKDAAEFVSTRIGWVFCEPEYAPKVKEFPVCNDLTEAGEKRRKRYAAQNEVVEVIEETGDLSDLDRPKLLSMASKLKIPGANKMDKTGLLEALEEFNKTKKDEPSTEGKE